MEIRSTVVRHVFSHTTLHRTHIKWVYVCMSVYADESSIISHGRHLFKENARHRVVKKTALHMSRSCIPPPIDGLCYGLLRNSAQKLRSNNTIAKIHHGMIFLAVDKWRAREREWSSCETSTQYSTIHVRTHFLITFSWGLIPCLRLCFAAQVSFIRFFTFPPRFPVFTIQAVLFPSFCCPEASLFVSKNGLSFCCSPSSIFCLRLNGGHSRTILGFLASVLVLPFSLHCGGFLFACWNNAWVFLLRCWCW